MPKTKIAVTSTLDRLPKLELLDRNSQDKYSLKEIMRKITSSLSMLRALEELIAKDRAGKITHEQAMRDLGICKQTLDKLKLKITRSKQQHAKSNR